MPVTYQSSGKPHPGITHGHRRTRRPESHAHGDAAMAFHTTDIPAGTPVPAESTGRNAHIATIHPLVSRIGHGRGRTLITQLCAATTAQGPALESRPDPRDCASSSHFECQSRCVSPGAELGVCGLVADRWRAAAQPGCGRRRSPVAACAGAEGAASLIPVTGSACRARVPGQCDRWDGPDLRRGRRAGWAGRWLSRSPPRLPGLVIGPPTRGAASMYAGIWGRPDRKGRRHRCGPGRGARTGQLAREGGMRWP